jgi:hypothetical protein
MKRMLLTAGSALLMASAAFAGNNDKTCCKSGSKCEKVCSKKCDCGQKNCSPENCKSKDCGCSKK